MLTLLRLRSVYSQHDHHKKENQKLQSVPSFLNVRGDDWRGCLHTSLGLLRESWTTQWVGLPFVVDACANFLNLTTSTLTADGVKLLAVARELARRIEADVKRSPESKEPRYHNRLHFADVLTTVTLQAAIESEHANLNDKQWQAALILIAIAHDLQHPGRVNHHVAEIEQLSVDALRPYLRKHAVPDAWIKHIEHVILSSDFSLVSENHKRVAELPFCWNEDWAIVLINEADVMASVSEAFGSELGCALASEWALASLPMHSSVATNQGRLDFLTSTVFSSHSATVLGAPSERLKQLTGDQK